MRNVTAWLDALRWSWLAGIPAAEIIDVQEQEWQRVQVLDLYARLTMRELLARRAAAGRYPATSRRPI